MGGDAGMTRALTGVAATFCAAHRSAEGVLHGHTWEVVAWWEGSPDAVLRQKELNQYLKIFDHTLLADGVAWGEKLAEAICVGLNCVAVDINRPLERIYARFEA